MFTADRKTFLQALSGLYYFLVAFTTLNAESNCAVPDPEIQNDVPTLEEVIRAVFGN